MTKVCWATRTELVPRYQKLLEFARRHGLKAEADTYERFIRALGGQAPPPASKPAK